MEPSKEKKIIPLKTRGKPAEKRVFAITSGKGGVGKTNLVANIGYSLTTMGKKTLIMDADLGLGNIDVLLGLAPKFNLSHVVAGQKAISEILVEGPGGLKILPASSGVEEMTSLSKHQKMRILNELESAIEDMDIVLIDTAAGISSNVMYFNSVAQDIIVVVSPEPTSITDAYAVMKLLSTKYNRKKFLLVTNFVRSVKEGIEIFRQLKMVTDRFLDLELKYLGHVFLDENVTISVKWQKLLCMEQPDSVACRCFRVLADKLIAIPAALNGSKSVLRWDGLLNSE